MVGFGSGAKKGGYREGTTSPVCLVVAYLPAYTPRNFHAGYECDQRTYIDLHKSGNDADAIPGHGQPAVPFSVLYPLQRMVFDNGVN